MKVFITGATGYIGSCVTKELVSHGHTVMGLARNDRSAEKVKSLGGTPVQGSLDDLSALTEAAKASDAVIHMAFIHDFADPDHSLSDNVDKDIEALKALAKGLQGTDKKLINSHVSMVGPPGEMFTESMDKHPGLERISSSSSPRRVSTLSPCDYPLSFTERLIPNSFPLKFSLPRWLASQPTLVTDHSGGRKFTSSTLPRHSDWLSKSHYRSVKSFTQFTSW
jgi:hypothetical protein